MTLAELSWNYWESAGLLRRRICQLQRLRCFAAGPQREYLERRIRTLQPLLTETQKLAVLMERYYKGGCASHESCAVQKPKQ